MSGARGNDDWRLPPPFGVRAIAVLLLSLPVLAWTGHRVEMDRAAVETAKGIGAAVGAIDDSQVARGFSSIARRLWPPVVEQRTDTARIAGFDRRHLPLLARIETDDVREDSVDPESLQLKVHRHTREVLVEPFGYLATVTLKLIETLEIALWGTLLSVAIGLPLAVVSASNLTPHPVVRVASRGVVALLRAVPELIGALFLVLAYGFGPVAGVLALALHSTGFLGKFYAEDIENADKAPQDALEAIGAGKLKMLRYAILPQVLPQYVAYTLYILDRNVRMATVIGLVGAGGIGQELKGRYDLYQYGHVATVLIAIFILVFALDQLASSVRRRLI